MNAFSQFPAAIELPVRRRGPTVSAAAACRVLGLPGGESDPVRIILAAQIRLRRWRRLGESGQSGGTFGHVRRIIRARDALLQESYGRSVSLRSQVIAEVK